MHIDRKSSEMLDYLTRLYPKKLASEDKIFSHIHRGNRIFIGTGCGEPQYLVNALTNYARSNPKSFSDAEVLAHRRGKGPGFDL